MERNKFVREQLSRLGFECSTLGQISESERELGGRINFYMLLIDGENGCQVEPEFVCSQSLGCFQQINCPLRLGCQGIEGGHGWFDAPVQNVWQFILSYYRE